MNAYEKNDLVEYGAQNYGFILDRNEKINLEAFADQIEKIYSKHNPINRIVCTWLRGTEGIIEKDRTGKIKLMYCKYID